MSHLLRSVGSNISKRRPMRRTRVRTKLSGKTRFRALVRQVMANIAWLDSVEDESGVGTVTIKMHIRAIQTKYKKGDIHVDHVKCILRKKYEFRTEEEKETLFEVLGGFKCFRRYPEEVRKMLVDQAYFVYFGAHRVLVRQGHESTFMAVILKGEVEVYDTYIDPVFHIPTTERKQNLLPGDMIGEIELLHGLPREHTVKTASDVELLVVYKQDFIDVLKDTLQKHWDEIKSYLKMFPYFFGSWSDNEIRACCTLAEIKHYDAQDIVLNGENTAKNNDSYFILKGKCSLVRKLLVEHVGNKLVLVENQEQKRLTKSIDYIIAQVCIYNTGSCFGIGENYQSCVVMAEDSTTVLVVPRYKLYDNNAANIWNRARLCLSTRIPSAREVFDKCMMDRRRTAYSHDIMTSLQRRNVDTGTTVHDAPLVYRAQHARGPPAKWT